MNLGEIEDQEKLEVSDRSRSQISSRRLSARFGYPLALGSKPPYFAIHLHLQPPLFLYNPLTLVARFYLLCHF